MLESEIAAAGLLALRAQALERDIEVAAAVQRALRADGRSDWAAMLRRLYRARIHPPRCGRLWT